MLLRQSPLADLTVDREMRSGLLRGMQLRRLVAVPFVRSHLPVPTSGRERQVTRSRPQRPASDMPLEAG